MNRKKAMEKVERIVSQAEEVPFVKRIVLFGSLAKEAGEVNDVDLHVEVDFEHSAIQDMILPISDLDRRLSSRTRKELGIQPGERISPVVEMTPWERFYELLARTPDQITETFEGKRQEVRGHRLMNHREAAFLKTLERVKEKALTSDYEWPPTFRVVYERA